MATLTITLTSTPLSGTKTYTVSDADVSALIAWAQAFFPQSGSPLTPQQALLAWVQDWVDRTRGQVQQFNTTQNVPPPITLT